MTITTRCRNCGREYDADRAAIRLGPRWWRLCPVCRDPSPPGGPANGQPVFPPILTPEAA